MPPLRCRCAPVAAADLPSSAVSYATDAGETLAVRGAYHGDPIAADHLPPDLAKAVVAIEDRRFYEHYGIDPRGIVRAAFNNLTGSETEGGSTITQQLARLRYLSSDRTLRRKVQEAMIALWLEARLGKNEILAGYLNSVYFGAGAVGADAASRRYFGKPVGEIDLAQSAMLAGLIRAPSAAGAEPQSESRAAPRARRAPGDARRAARSTRPSSKRRAPSRSASRSRPRPEPNQNYFLDTADAEVKRLIGNPPLDLAVTTTIDPRLQDGGRAGGQVLARTRRGSAATSARPRWSRWRRTARSSRWSAAATSCRASSTAQPRRIASPARCSRSSFI